MKKLIALLMCLVMVFSITCLLTGCEKGDGEDKDTTSQTGSNDGEKKEENASIYNTWEGELNLAEFINAGLGASDDEMMDVMGVDKFICTVRFEINKDGDYALTIDEDSVAVAFEGLKKDWTDSLTDYIEELASQNDMTLDDFLAIMEMESMDEFMDMMFAEVNVEDLIGGMDLESDGSYDLDGSTITFDEGITLKFEIKGKEMTADWSTELDDAETEMVVEALPKKLTVK